MEAMNPIDLENLREGLVLELGLVELAIREVMPRGYHAVALVHANDPADPERHATGEAVGFTARGAAELAASRARANGRPIRKPNGDASGIWRRPAVLFG